MDEHEEVAAGGYIPKPDGLDAIAAEAAQFEQGELAGAVQVEALPEPSGDESAEWIQAAHMAAALLFKRHPRLRDEWKDAEIDAWGGAFAKVAALRGWKFSGLLTNPWVNLAFASYGLGESLVRVIREDRAASAAGAAK